MKHIMLHIPKLGGTSVCNRVEQSTNLTTVMHTNCQKWAGSSFCPLWCCCDVVKPTKCSSIDQWEEDFLMNENYLDEFCPQRTYSIILREPTTRTISHINHLMKATVSKWTWLRETSNINWRLSLVQANYMTWSLSAYPAWKEDSSIDRYQAL